MQILRWLTLMTVCFELHVPVKCGTYVLNRNHHPNEPLTSGRNHSKPSVLADHSYNDRQVQVLVHVDDPRGGTQDGPPIVVSCDGGPVTINFKAARPAENGPGRPSCSPIVVTSRGRVTVDCDDDDGSDTPSSAADVENDGPAGPVATNLERDMCLLTRTTAELPSGIVMPYLKFKTVAAYLPSDLKSDTRFALDGQSMSWEQFRRTLRAYGCSDLQQREDAQAAAIRNYVQLEDGTQMAADDYRNVVVSLAAGSESVAVSDAFRGPYSAYRTLLSDVLPELAPSAFVVSPAGFVVPFAMYRAVELELRSNGTASSPPPPRSIKWLRDGRPVDVDTVRRVIDALSARPETISYVFPNRKRLPFVSDGRVNQAALYDCDPEHVAVDIGARENVPVSLFDDIVRAVHIPDDECGIGAYNTAFHVVRATGIRKTRNGTTGVPAKFPVIPGRHENPSDDKDNEIQTEYDAPEYAKKRADCTLPNVTNCRRNQTEPTRTENSTSTAPNVSVTKDNVKCDGGDEKSGASNNRSSNTEQPNETSARTPAQPAKNLTVAGIPGRESPLITSEKDNGTRTEQKRTNSVPNVTNCRRNQTENSSLTPSTSCTTAVTDVPNDKNPKPLAECDERAAVKFDNDAEKNFTVTNQNENHNNGSANSCSENRSVMNNTENRTRAHGSPTTTNNHCTTDESNENQNTKTDDRVKPTFNATSLGLDRNSDGRPCSSANNLVRPANQTDPATRFKTTTALDASNGTVTNDTECTEHSNTTTAVCGEKPSELNNQTKPTETERPSLRTGYCANVQNDEKPLVGRDEHAAVKFDNDAESKKNITAVTATNQNGQAENHTNINNSCSENRGTNNSKENQTSVHDSPSDTTKNRTTDKSNENQHKINDDRVELSTTDNLIKTANQTDPTTQFKTTTLGTSNGTVTNDTECAEHSNLTGTSATNTVREEKPSELNNQTKPTAETERPCALQVTKNATTRTDDTNETKKNPTKIGTTSDNNNINNNSTSLNNNKTAENLSDRNNVTETCKIYRTTNETKNCNTSPSEIKTAETKAICVEKRAGSTNDANGTLFQTDVMNAENAKLIDSDKNKTAETKNGSVCAPIYTEVIKSPNNGSVTNNKVINIIVC